MNQQIEYLYSRRVAINYVSPAACEILFSSTAEPVIVLEPFAVQTGPTGLILSPFGSGFRLSWDAYPGAICYSVYKAVDELDPYGDYELIAECITDPFLDVDDNDEIYRIEVITPEGTTPLSPPAVPPIVPPPPTPDGCVPCVDAPPPEYFEPADEEVIQTIVAPSESLTSVEVLIEAAGDYEIRWISGHGGFVCPPEIVGGFALNRIPAFGLKDESDNYITLNDPYDGLRQFTQDYTCFINPPINPPSCDPEADLLLARPDGVLGTFSYDEDDVPVTLTAIVPALSTPPCAPGGATTYQIVRVGLSPEVEILNFALIAPQLICLPGAPAGAEFNGHLVLMSHDENSIYYYQSQGNPLYLGVHRVGVGITGNAGNSGGYWQLTIIDWDQPGLALWNGTKYCGATAAGTYMLGGGLIPVESCPPNAPQCLTVVEVP